jgi:amidase
MFKTPTVDEVIAVAEKIGMSVGPEEAALYQRLLIPQLRAFDEFVQSRTVEEAVPPLLYGTRHPGYRPSAAEDPLGAWLWRCHIEGSGEGLLAGKTVSYKDHVAVAGVPLTFGSFVMEGFIADFDATIVTRVLKEGGTISGKNTMNGFVGGYGSGGRIGDYDPPKNPHDARYVSGGSSSGSAVAVATAQVDISFGGDQGGSIRIPAAWSGTVGLKPTFGLVSHFGVAFGYDQSMDYTGPMARTVDDAAAALQAVAGYDGLDPRQSRAVPEHLDVVGPLAHGVDGVRIGILQEGFEDAEPDVRDLVMAAIDVIAEAGAVVSEVSIPEHLVIPKVAAVIMAEGSLAIRQTGIFGAFDKTYYPPSLIAAINKMWEHESDLISPRHRFGFLLAEFSRQNYHGRAYAKAHNLRPTFVKAYDSVLADVDVLVMPTTIMKAFEAGGPDDYLESLEGDITMLARNLTRNTMPFNYTGHPALAVPCGKSGGLPVSLQLVTSTFADPLLLQVAYAYQSSVDWNDIVGVLR